MIKAISIVLITLLAFFIYTLLAWVPVYLYAEAKCLAHGYPNTYVSVSLGRYCANFDSSVMVDVSEL